MENVGKTFRMKNPNFVGEYFATTNNLRGYQIFDVFNFAKDD